MNAYNASRSFAAPASADRMHRRAATHVAVKGDPRTELHNSRGLVIAILMSAACWAGVGLAFLI
jgi:hypothetical protein